MRSAFLALMQELFLRFPFFCWNLTIARRAAGSIVVATAIKPAFGSGLLQCVKLHQGSLVDMVPPLLTSKMVPTALFEPVIK